MAKPTSNPHILELAKRGAAAQLRDLVQEMRYLLELFPHLRDSFDSDELPLRFIMAKDSGHATKKGGVPVTRTRKKMSPAARKAVGERMKKYWAAKRKEAAK